MASTKGYLDFILEQLGETESVTCRAMMGEYILYCRGKIFGGVYDDRLLVKPTRAALAMLPDAVREAPYPGAKEMLLVDRFDDRAFLKTLVEAMADELPAVKKRGMRKDGDSIH